MQGRGDAKRGGYEGPDGFVFELTGGRLCLDFANTLDERLTLVPKERLRTYRDLVGWSVQAGAIDGSEAEELLSKAQRSPSAAEAALGRALLLREALFEIFTSEVDGGPAPSRASKRLGEALEEAFDEPTLERAEHGYRLEWRGGARALHRMLHPVVRSAAELLTSEELRRVRLCASATCAWLFLDQTRNRSRRWCDMTVCGNREKARRFYRRRKLESEDAS